VKIVPLVWTTEPPTEPGWYWVFWKDSSPEVGVYEFNGEEFWVGADTHTLDWLSHFAGPIPEPQEEK
jgi:hypothetical protein